MSGLSSLYILISHSSNRWLTSTLIHSRACWSELYSAAGRLLSGTVLALVVSLRATMSRGVSGPSPSGSVP